MVTLHAITTHNVEAVQQPAQYQKFFIKNFSYLISHIRRLSKAQISVCGNTDIKPAARLDSPTLSYSFQPLLDAFSQRKEVLSYVFGCSLLS